MARNKLKRIGEFNELPNCLRGNGEHKGKWQRFFGNDHPLTLELGCGKAELSYGLAGMHPDRNYIGIDLKPARLWTPAQRALTEQQKNIAFMAMNLLTLKEEFEENEVDELWITFPDPFPKKRQAKHRMLNAKFLALYQHVLKPEGKVRFKTDNLELFQYSLEVFVEQGNIELEELSFDLHQSDCLTAETGIKTHYEKKFLEMGKKINYTRFRFK